MGIAYGNVAIANTPSNTAARVRSKLVDWVEPCPELTGRSDDCHPDRVFRVSLHSRCRRENLRFLRASDRNHTTDGRNSLGDCAGFVQHYRVDITCALQDLAALDQEPELGAAAGRNHDRCGNREAHGARAGDDEHGNRRRDRARQRRGIRQKIPGEKSDDRDRNDDGDKYGTDAVRQTLNRSARALRLSHHFHDTGENAVGADTHRPKTERSSRVERAADDLSADGLRDRKWLSGQHRFVEIAAPLDDRSINGHALARPNDYRIARYHL